MLPLIGMAGQVRARTAQREVRVDGGHDPASPPLDARRPLHLCRIGLRDELVQGGTHGHDER